MYMAYKFHDNPPLFLTDWATSAELGISYLDVAVGQTSDRLSGHICNFESHSYFTSSRVRSIDLT